MPIFSVLSAEAEENLLAVLHRADIGVESICGGRGACGKCRIRILEGETTPPTSAEEKALSPEELARGIRLACQANPCGDLRIYVPATSLVREPRLQLDSALDITEVSPPVEVREVEVRIPEVPGDHGSDLTRLIQALAADGRERPPMDSDIMALRDLSPRIRYGRGKARAVVREGELLGTLTSGEKALGLAVDLGSTKVALYVHDLVTGETVADRGFLNPQVALGEDVVTRIQHALEDGDKRLELMRLVVEGINENLEEMLASSGASPSDVFEAMVVGNTAMHHLFLGLSVEQLARSPYLPATDLPLGVKARDLGLKLNPAAVVYLPPPIAGYVGSDHLAAVAATRLHRRTGPCLLLDIGTNTEVALKAGGRILSCSCASGPAFEGMGLSQGMRAEKGAVERVFLNPATGELEISVIGDGPPLGICGSGILSALAALLELGVLEESGRMREEFPGLWRRGEEPAYYLVPPGGDNGEGVAVTQADVREIQKAKGAIRAGVDALLLETGTDYGDLEEVILAGAFGSYLDPAVAVSLSLLPPVSLDRVVQVGNAAGAGARAMLLSLRFRREAEELAGRIEYLELSAHPTLAQLFAASMYLSEDAVRKAQVRLRLRKPSRGG